MSQADVPLEANDYLLGVGDPEFLTNAYADVRGEVGLTLPVWATARTIVNLWSFLALTAPGVATDQTIAAQGAGIPLTSLTVGAGHLLGGTGKYEVITYLVTVPQNAAPSSIDVTYWGGITWFPATLLQAPNFAVSGLQVLQIVLPQDWTPGLPDDVTLPVGFDVNRYWLRILWTTAPTITAPQASVDVLQHTWPLEAREHELLAVAYYPTDLTETEVSASLELTQPDWRTQVGTPRMYHQAEETALAVRLVPLPTAQGAEHGLLGIVGGGGDPVDNNLVVCAAVVPNEVDIPPWLEGLVVLRLAAREAQRLGETGAPELTAALVSLSQGVESVLRDVMQEELR